MRWSIDLIETLPKTIKILVILVIFATPIVAFVWEYLNTQPGEKIVIFGVPIVTKPEASPNISDPPRRGVALVVRKDLRTLREANGVSELSGLEVGKPLRELPNGKYGFSPPWKIDSNPVGVVGGTGFDLLTLGRKGGTSVMEVHKSSTGGVYVVGYLLEEILLRAQDPTRTSPISATLFFEPSTGRHPVAISQRMILSSKNRYTENHESNAIYVNDLQLGGV